MRASSRPVGALTAARSSVRVSKRRPLKVAVIGLAVFRVEGEPMRRGGLESALDDGIQRDLVRFVGLGVRAG
jgi:hypothetical protein